jgi:hypothetical protein
MAVLRLAMARSEGNGDSGDDLSDGILGLVARGREPVGVRREADAVREDRHRQIMDVVGDAVRAAA